MASRDDNGYPILYGVSHVDGITPVQIKFDSFRQMLTDTTTAIEFSPTLDVPNGVGVPLAKATSSADNKTVRPWVVNASTGAVLTDE